MWVTLCGMTCFTYIILQEGKAGERQEMKRLHVIRYTEITCDVASVKQTFAVNWQEIRNASTRRRLCGAGFFPGLIDLMCFNGFLMDIV